MRIEDMRFIATLPRRPCGALSLCLTLIIIGLASTISYGAPESNPTESRIPAGVKTSDTTGAGEEIKRLIGKYAKSIDEADTTLASQVWWNSLEVSFIHPLGHEHGFDQIKQNVYKHLMGDTFLERKLTVHDVSVHVYRDAAWAEFYWDFAAKLRKDGSPITTHGRETQIYRKAPGGWRLVHVHYSGMPVMERNFVKK
jgi:ketosteroid isomerase-like protein